MDQKGREDGPRDGPDDGRGDLWSAFAKLMALALAVGLVIAGGLFLVIRTLGLGGGETAAPTDVPTDSRTPLPTVALPSGDGSPSGSATPEETPTTSAPPDRFALTAPSSVQPGARIYLTGTYTGQDGTVLQVQRQDGQRWGPFADVDARVQGDTFRTYVITQRSGPQVFRVLDQAAGKASNPVTVQVG